MSGIEAIPSPVLERNRMASSSYEKYRSPEHADVESVDLVLHYQETDCEDCFRELVHRYHPLITRYSLKYARYYMPAEDLYQQGLLGLMLAARKFDFSRSLRITAMMKQYIRGYIANHLRDYGALIRIPRAEYAAHREREGLTFTPVSHSEEMGDDVDKDSEDFDYIVKDEATYMDWADSVDGILLYLEPKLRLILIKTLQGYSQRDIGRELGISQMHVGRLIKRAVKQLAKDMGVVPKNATG